jgi:hypothetical protein
MPIFKIIILKPFIEHRISSNDLHSETLIFCFIEIFSLILMESWVFISFAIQTKCHQFKKY